MKYILIIIFSLLCISCNIEKWRTKCIDDKDIRLITLSNGYKSGDTITINFKKYVLLNKVNK